VSAALTLGITGTAINAVHAVSKHSDPFPVLMAGTILTVLFVALEPSGIGGAAAGVYLLGSFLVNGTTLIDILSAATTSKKG